MILTSGIFRFRCSESWREDARASPSKSARCHFTRVFWNPRHQATRSKELLRTARGVAGASILGRASTLSTNRALDEHRITDVHVLHDLCVSISFWLRAPCAASVDALERCSWCRTSSFNWRNHHSLCRFQDGVFRRFVEDKLKRSPSPRYGRFCRRGIEEIGERT